MKAAYYQGNKQFKVADAQPVPPGPGEVRLNVAYCGICGTDIHIYHGAMDQRVKPPQVIGHEMSGTVAELGEGVTGFQVGDPVVVRPLDNREMTPADKGIEHIPAKLKFLGIDTPGAFQATWTVPAFTLHKLPAGIDMKKAAMIEPLAVACHDIRRGRLKAGEKAVVLGGGPIGMLVALAAKEAGADVMVSELNPHRLDLARKLGFRVVNPKEADPVQVVNDWTDQAGADVVFEVSGAPPAALQMTELACIRGRIVMVAIYPKPVEVNLFRFFWRELELIGARVYEPQDYEQAIKLVAEDRLPLDDLITAVKPLDQLPDAFRELDSNPNAMKVLIKCSD